MATPQEKRNVFCVLLKQHQIFINISYIMHERRVGRVDYFHTYFSSFIEFKIPILFH